MVNAVEIVNKTIFISNEKITREEVVVCVFIAKKQLQQLRQVELSAITYENISNS